MIHRALFVCAGLLLAAGLARDGLEAWVAQTEMPVTLHQSSTEVLDRHGTLMRVFPVETGRWRMHTEVEDVDPTYLDMLIAVEDKRFWSHQGVDPWAMLRAAGQAVWRGEIVSGASTLTMQTARLLENGGTGGWAGKLRQVRVALAMEQRLSKRQILSLYLTHAPFGGPLEGVRAASYAWFGKPPHRLSEAEAALLVALPQAPEARRPDRFPEAAKAARDAILARVGGQTGGAGVPQQMRPMPRLAPHATERFAGRSDTVRLTLDAALHEKIAQLAVRATDGLPQDVTAAILVAEHSTGAIRAYVGAAEYGDDRAAGFVDMVQAVRSPGSTLKPLIYGLAFDQGIAHPETRIADRPMRFGSYAPQNFDGVFRGEVTVRQALQASLNLAPVQLTERLTPARVLAALRRGGATPRLPGDGRPGLAIALGGLGLSLQDLVQLYAGLAAGGPAPRLHLETQAVPDHAGRLVSRSAAWQVGDILAGIQPPAGQPIGHVAFKTGTSYGHRDAWALGWDGTHVIGVWLGRADGTPVPGIFGGEIAAPILFEAFERASVRRTPLPPPPPETLIAPTGLLPAPLQRFETAQDRAAPGVRLAFPPSGAQVVLGHGQGLLVKIDGGTAPFAVLANGRPVRTGLLAREAYLSDIPVGFADLQVVDARGHADVARVELRSAMTTRPATP